MNKTYKEFIFINSALGVFSFLNEKSIETYTVSVRGFQWCLFILGIRIISVIIWRTFYPLHCTFFPLRSARIGIQLPAPYLPHLTHSDCMSVRTVSCIIISKCVVGFRRWRGKEGFSFGRTQSLRAVHWSLLIALNEDLIRTLFGP